MTHDIIHAISQAALATTPLAAQPSSAAQVLLTMLLGLAVSLGLAYRIYQLSKQLAAWQKAMQAANDASQQTQQQLNQARKKLADRQAQIDELTIGLGQQRKKTHSLQETIKELRAKLLEQVQLMQQAAKAKPAFTQSVSEPAEKPVIQPTRAEKSSTSASKPVREAVPQDAALLKTAQEQISHLQQQISQQTEKIALLNSELRKAHKHQESTRRADLVTKGKIKLLEDKLRHQGRQYYDAISELAALKGEVVLPLPRGKTKSIATPNNQEAHGD